MLVSPLPDSTIAFSGFSLDWQEKETIASTSAITFFILCIQKLIY